MASNSKGKEECLAIGIDLGTTYSCVALYRRLDHKVEILINGQGHRTTPSCVAFTLNERLVGPDALRQAGINPANTIFDAKRLIGRTFNEEEIQAYMKNWPFKVVEERGDGVNEPLPSGNFWSWLCSSQSKTREEGKRPVYEVEHKGRNMTFCAEEISSMVLSYLRDVAETFLKRSVNKAIITVPTHFNDAQRKATCDAAVIAGLEVLGIVNEPTAAAIGYVYDAYEIRRSGDIVNILIFDFGGGTFDVTIMAIKGDKLIVRATAGDTHLGGEDITNNLVEHVKELLAKKKLIQIHKINSKSLSRIKRACEDAKKALSFSEEAVINIEFPGGVDFQHTLTRSTFEKLNENLFSKLLSILKKCLVDARMEKLDIAKVMFVGGSSRIPKVKALVGEFFKNNVTISEKLNPDEAVAHGAAICAAIRTSVLELDLEFQDVTSISLGIADCEGKMNVMVPRNTPIPVTKKQNWQTTKDNQTSVTCRIYEGEERTASENKPLGRFKINGLTPSLAGECKLEITMHIDASGILLVSERDQNGDANGKIEICDQKGVLSRKEVDRMFEDAKKYKAEVQQKKKLHAWLVKIEHMFTDPQNISFISKGTQKKFKQLATETKKWLENEKRDVRGYSDYESKIGPLEELWNIEFECDQMPTIN